MGESHMSLNKDREINWETLKNHLAEKGIYQENPTDEAYVITSIDNIKKAFASLKDREQEVLIIRFGLQDGVDKTLAKAGEHFDLSRERIRQIEKKALSKIRHWERRNYK